MGSNLTVSTVSILAGETVPNHNLRLAFQNAQRTSRRKLTFWDAAMQTRTDHQYPTRSSVHAKFRCQAVYQKRVTEDIDLKSFFLVIHRLAVPGRDLACAQQQRIDGLRILRLYGLSKLIYRGVASEVAIQPIEDGVG